MVADVQANILVGVTGGIAAYKSPDVVRRLKERGYAVKVVMTAGCETVHSSSKLFLVAPSAVATQTGTQTPTATCL